MRRAWEAFWNSLDLMARLENVERSQRLVVAEWSDVLDKLVAREERQRKRDRKRIVTTEEDAPYMEQPETIPGTPFLKLRGNHTR